MSGQTNIDSVLTETRVFEPSNEFRAHAHIGSFAEYERLYREAEQNPAQFWGADRLRTALVQAVGAGAGVELSLGEMVRGRPDQPVVQLPGPPRGHLAAKQSRLDLGRRARRGTNAHLPATAHGGVEVRERFEIAGRKARRPRRHLHGDVPGPAHRHAGVRAHRRAAHHHLRRLLLQRAGGSHHGFAGMPGDHAGRLLPARRRSEVEARRG